MFATVDLSWSIHKLLLPTFFELAKWMANLWPFYPLPGELQYQYGRDGLNLSHKSTSCISKGPTFHSPSCAQTQDISNFYLGTHSRSGIPGCLPHLGLPPGKLCPVYNKLPVKWHTVACLYKQLYHGLCLSDFCQHSSLSTCYVYDISSQIEYCFIASCHSLVAPAKLVLYIRPPINLGYNDIYIPAMLQETYPCTGWWSDTWNFVLSCFQ